MTRYIKVSLRSVSGTATEYLVVDTQNYTVVARGATSSDADAIVGALNS